ncbi:unnamed protein product [Spirodela intermedia]|uniref:RNA-binding protein 48 n=2 Tax=Spirodela intermedia TaxID=51605 RepID=A0A7I8J7Z2_SPIIN|nr:unnamed protein product [Spirodela intermedia]CAA6665543.1 unnamed protein product [Spirodela intermedia]CAA7402277.1 unnamed protein product [Spirodela intermedia]
MPRESDEPPAVRVYTVCDESRYLIVRNVPALGCGEELAKLFGTYGEIEESKPMDAEDSETFTDVFWIKFSKISNARFAKRKLDEFVFYGNRLQVSYAPQFESLSDTKEKLEDRRKEVLRRIRSISVHKGVQLVVLNVSESGGRRHFFKLLLYPLLNTGDGHSMEHVKSQTLHMEGGIIGHVSSNEDYFPSPSMNKTVTLVREKLDKITSSSGPSDSDQPSRKSCFDKRRRI